jgi:flagellar hook-associated protein 3 FlgL
MRITANTYTDLVISSSQTSQQRLATIQQQISSGNTVQNPSDDPLTYGQASQTQNQLAQLTAYSQAAQQATTMTAQNNTAMTSLHQLVAQGGEYLSSVTSNMTSSQLQDIGTEMNSLITQLTSIVNQKSTDGTYLDQRRRDLHQRPGRQPRHGGHRRRPLGHPPGRRLSL